MNALALGGIKASLTSGSGVSNQAVQMYHTGTTVRIQPFHDNSVRLGFDPGGSLRDIVSVWEYG